MPQKDIRSTAWHDHQGSAKLKERTENWVEKIHAGKLRNEKSTLVAFILTQHKAWAFHLPIPGDHSLSDFCIVVKTQRKNNLAVKNYSAIA